MRVPDPLGRNRPVVQGALRPRDGRGHPDRIPPDPRGGGRDPSPSRAAPKSVAAEATVRVATRRPRRRRRVLGGLLALAALAAACSSEPISVTVDNPTADEYLLRLSWSYGEVHVFRVPSGKGASAVSLQSGYRPLVEILRPDCSVVGSWTLDASALIRIGPDGRPSVGPPGEFSPGTEPPETVTEEVAACGATQFSPGPS